MEYATHVLDIRVALNMDALTSNKESLKATMLVLGVDNDEQVLGSFGEMIIEEINKKVLGKREEVAKIIDGNISVVSPDEGIEETEVDASPSLEGDANSYDEMRYAMDFAEGEEGAEVADEYLEPRLVTEELVGDLIPDVVDTEYEMSEEALEEIGQGSDIYMVGKEILKDVNEIEIYAGNTIAVYLKDYDKFKGISWNPSFPLEDMEDFAPDMVEDYEYIISYEDALGDKKLLKKENIK